MRDPYFLLPRDALAKIAEAEASGGGLLFRHVPADDFYVVARVEVAIGLRLPVHIPKEYERLAWGDDNLVGQWVRTSDRGVNHHHWYLIHRPGAGIPFEAFKELVPGIRDPGANLGFLVTHDPGLPQEHVEAGVVEFAAWFVTRTEVRPAHVAIEPDTLGIDQLADAWPVQSLASHSALIVGCGSIGSAAAEALAAYGIGRLELVDPDRLLWHNLIRHTLGPEHVGRLKVDGLRTQLNQRWPATTVNTHGVDVVESAHHMRPLFRQVDMVVCAADGVAPRRVVNHLARRARKPAVLACVLDHGRIGEVIRLQPSPRFGCLLCLRDHLAQQGAMDAEADQELDYGTGRVHRPMTATPPDLRLVGTFAAKTAVATLLETHYGDHTQRLPGECAIVGLQPMGDLTPPFDLQRAGEIRWQELPPPRPDCPTCRAV